jgi:hypothetical protein
VAAPRTILRWLKDHDGYLNNFPPREHTAYFEYLVAEAFAHILHLPLFTSSDDDPLAPHRVTWFGRLDPVMKAPEGEDARALAHGYCLLIQPTLSTGTNQWTREFGPCCTHYEAFVRTSGFQPNDVYVILVAPEVHARTWESIRQVQFNCIVVTVGDLAEVLLTSILAFTVSHSQLRQLLNTLVACRRRAESRREFAARSERQVRSWQGDTLQTEKKPFFAARAYRAMRLIDRANIGVGEILQRLQRDPVTRQYSRLSATRVSSDMLEMALVDHGLACSVGQTLPGETMLCPVPLTDFADRQERMMRIMEGFDG